MRSAVVAVLVCVAALTSCGGSLGRGADGAASREETLTVLAASSLGESFETLAERFERDHPGVAVRLAFDSSATLARQVREGAPADVLATADLETMREVLDAGAVRSSTTFATNHVVLVTPAGNPEDVGRLTDLDRDDVTYVACVETAPCGKVAARLLRDAGVQHPPGSLEVDVKAVLAKVTADEADAGLVYATDAQAAGRQVQAFDVPGSRRVPNGYAIAVVERTGHRDLAQAWVDLVTGEAGQRMLADAGFGPAP